MQIHYREIGVCGLSCRLCPAYHAGEHRWCDGCKREKRMTVGCPFLTCALKKHGVEFCWDCKEHPQCDRWQRHRAYGTHGDSFKCYQTLEKDIAFVQHHGVATFARAQKKRESLLTEMLREFNEGRSKSYYCIAATIMDEQELKDAINQAKKTTKGMDLKGKAKVLHAILDNIAQKKGYHLKLRKP